MQPAGNMLLDLLTCLMEMSLVLRLPRDMHATKPTRLAHFSQGAESIAFATQNDA